jgi:hypothetical protein
MTAERRHGADGLSALVLAGFAMFWIAQWPLLPFLMDSYYHLLIARQMEAAGGPIGFEWWQYAPVGRAHLYPPVLHLVLLALLKAGAGPLMAIRLLAAGLPPLLLASIYAAMRRLLGAQVALACVAVALVPYSFQLQAGVALAATLGMIELLWLMVTIEEGRIRAAGLLWALLGYTHLGMPWIALGMVAAYAWWQPSRRRQAAQSVWGLGLVAPWWWHLLQHRGAMHPAARYENVLLDLTPVLLGFAALGLWACVRQGGRWRWLVACAMGFLVLAPQYAYRWLCGEGLLPLILLAGAGLLWGSQRLSCTPRGRAAWLAAGWVMLLCSPTLLRTDEGWRWRWPDSGLSHLLGVESSPARDLSVSAQSAPFQRFLVSAALLLRPGDILWSNAPYALGVAAALWGQPTSTAMLDEMTPVRPMDPQQSASLLVWFKLPGGPEVAQALRDQPLQRVMEDDVAVIFRREGPVAHVPQPKAVMPAGWALGLLGAAALLVGYDLTRQRTESSV